MAAIRFVKWIFWYLLLLVAGSCLVSGTDQYLITAPRLWVYVYRFACKCLNALMWTGGVVVFPFFWSRILCYKNHLNKQYNQTKDEQTACMLAFSYHILYGQLIFFLEYAWTVKFRWEKHTFVFPPFQTISHSSFVLSQTYLALAKFIKKYANIYDIKLLTLDTPCNIYRLCIYLIL